MVYVVGKSNDCGGRGCPMGSKCSNEAMRSHVMDGHSNGGRIGCPMDFVYLES